MQIPENSELIRIFIGESDRYGGRPLYEIIVESARNAGLAGATVLRGVSGFGATSRIHTSKILRLSEDLPIVIEIVDAVEKIESFLPELQKLVKGGLITIEKVRVLAYRSDGSPSA
jgi:PII-like signaling protein